MRKPCRDVELDDIISSQIIGDDSDVIATVLKTHLALEALVIEMLRRSWTDDKLYRLSYPSKTEALVNAGVITQNDQIAFNRFNDFRNDMAHAFGHTITPVTSLALARELESRGVDFSDSIGHYSEGTALEYYGNTVGILAEIGWCILFHAAYRLQEAGGRSIF